MEFVEIVWTKWFSMCKSYTTYPACVCGIHNIALFFEDFIMNWLISHTFTLKWLLTLDLGSVHLSQSQAEILLIIIRNVKEDTSGVKSSLSSLCDAWKRLSLSSGWNLPSLRIWAARSCWAPSRTSTIKEETLAPEPA